MAKEMITPIIRFNLKERMRQFNGQERKFDIPKLVKVINSDKVQERVRLGDLNGFYGHHARIQFGAEPNEGGIVDGKYVHLEPCCRTIYLKAYEDGTVEHQQEFFATELGIKAWKRLQDKSGGFSSVISMKYGGDFHGFDYVNEPNYSGNRPYTLDSANAEENEPQVFVLDDVRDMEAGEKAFLMDSIEIYQQINARLTEENKLLAETLSNLRKEHDLLLDDIVIANEKLAIKEQQKQRQNTPHFDSAILDDAIRQANKFKTAKLEKTEDLLEDDQHLTQKRQVDRLIGRYGV